MNQRATRLLATTALSLFASHVLATNLLEMTYDNDRDELVIEAAYRGSSPDHSFSLNWGDCRDDTFAASGYQVEAKLIDARAAESGSEEFRQTLRFPLNQLACRPAKVTIVSAAGFHRTILVPEATTSEQ